MTVHIAPATEEDSQAIANALEGGICPWPGYQLIAQTGRPWVYVLPDEAAEALTATLYGRRSASLRAHVAEPDSPEVVVPLSQPGVARRILDALVAEHATPELADPQADAVAEPDAAPVPEADTVADAQADTVADAQADPQADSEADAPPQALEVADAKPSKRSSRRAKADPQH